MAIEKDVDINVNVKNAGAATSKIRGVKSATDKLSGSSKGLVSGLLNMSGGLKGVAVGAGVAGGALLALNIVNKVADWFKAATKAAIDFTKASVMMADSFDVMEKRLKALTGSQAEAAKAMKQIKDFAAGTTAQVDELTEAYIAMQPVFGEVSNELLLDVANAAAGAGRSIQTIADTFIRLKTGDFGVEQLRKLNIVKSDLEDFDVEFDASGKLISSVDEAMTGVQLLIRERFGNMQEEMATTLTGALSNLEDIWMQLKDSVGKELLPVINEFVRLIIEAVTEVMESGDLAAGFRKLAEALKRNKDVLDDIVKIIPAIAQAFADVVTAMGPMLDEFGQLNREMKTLDETGLSGVERFAKVISELSIPVVAAMDTLLQFAQMMESAKRGDWKAILALGGFAVTGGAGAGALYVANLRKAEKIIETGRAVAAARPESGTGVEGRITKGVRAGRVKGLTDTQIEDRIRSIAAEEGWSEEQIEAGVARFKTAGAGKAPPPPPPGAPPGGKPKELERTALAEAGGIDITEEHYQELLGQQEELDAREEDRAGKRKQRRREEYEEEKKLANEKEKERISNIESIAKALDPTQYIMEGLKSGNMRKAMEDWAVQLGTLAAQRLMSSLIVSGIVAILSMITGGAAGAIQGAVTAQHGMYTGSYEGPVMVHPGEVIAPLDTIGAMTTLINRSMMGAKLPTPGIPEGAGGGTTVVITEKASDLVDQHRAESVDRGNENLDVLEGVPY